MFQGKTDQIAFISHDAEDTQKIKESLGLQDAEWTEDFVLAEGLVRGERSRNTARLLFNYDTGIELEILQYMEGPHYAEHIPGGNICHFGIHSTAEFGEDVPVFDAPVIQQVETLSHTNPFLLANGRHYRYTIYDTYDALGVYTKVIERIEAGA